MRPSISLFTVLVLLFPICDVIYFTAGLGAKYSSRGLKCPVASSKDIRLYVNTLYKVHSGRILPTRLRGHLITWKVMWRCILANRHCTLLLSGSTAGRNDTLHEGNDLHSAINTTVGASLHCAPTGHCHDTVRYLQEHQ
jgi:hypothetical protein